MYPTFNFHVGSLLVTSGFYWLSAGIYAIMDFTQKPAFLMKYKIQQDKNVPVDPKRFLKVTSIYMVATSKFASKPEPLNGMLILFNRLIFSLKGDSDMPNKRSNEYSLVDD